MWTPSLLLLVTLLAIVSLKCKATTELLGPEKITRLRFYLHDTLSGKDPSAVLVARGADHRAKTRDPVPFSSVYAADDVLTEGPARRSKVVGNAQGLYVASGKGEAALVLGMDFELTQGPFNGSAFVVFSRNTITHPVGRELAIVGGRGAFRMARGFALLRTHYLDANNGDAIIEYNVTLLHH
ncbi:dirigent protein 4-like [Phragmites australis]|uniref:dirigent protein 4-like n=1 Tax=Phragmites australis TaxID=29695 RepID=UPI002D78A9ED|nr:dirigent protein 4-like [Phragmites australis]